MNPIMYVLTREERYEGGEVKGVFDTLAKARSAASYFNEPLIDVLDTTTELPVDYMMIRGYQLNA